MTARALDSRASLGSDMERDVFPDYRYRESSEYLASWSVVRTVRVVVGRLGSIVRLTANELGIVVDDDTIEKAWRRFVGEVAQRKDAPWLALDVGPTRRHEIDDGLNAPEDEDWSEPVESPGAD